MKTFYNKAEEYVREMLEGILLAHPGQVKSVPGEIRAIVRADAPVHNKVSIVTGGGSGHLPVFMGYVGKGLLDGAAVGNIFASPSVNQMLKVTKAVHGGKGVLYLYGNYGGDGMNFDMAAEEAEELGIRIKTLRVADDIASAPKGDESSRRGVAGLFYAYKVAGACADLGFALDEVYDKTKLALENIRTIGVAISPCTLPGASKPTFSLKENEMEIGMGIHGEAGIIRGERKSADETTARMLELLSADLELIKGDEVSVLINSLGATPLEELYIAFRKVRSIMDELGISVYKPLIGRYATSLEMAGFSISVFRLNNEFKEYLNHPVQTPFIREGGL